MLFPRLRGLRILCVEDTGEAVAIRACCRAACARCPSCGVVSARIHGAYARVVAGGRPVLIILAVRRFRCPDRSCAKATFAEQAEDLSVRYRRRSVPLLGMLAAFGLELGGRAGSRLAGFTASGYYPGAISECTYQGKQYCYPIGTNSVGLFYNKAMLAAAGLQPPTTWDELAADAKKLTKPPVYGMAFDATADEQSTWQLEPFFWSNGASLTKVDTPPFESALQLWVNMVKDGSASKSVLNWGQDPDLTQQFIQGHAAMTVNGPWIFPELNQKGWKYNDQYGIVPIPTDKAGQTVVAPLGGETLDLGTGGSTEQQKLAWEWVEGMQQASTMEHVTSLMYYLPSKPAVTAQFLKGGPEYTVFAKETQTARSRTTEYGANYPKVSQAIWTAIQAAITGTSSVSSALQTAQGTISGVQQVSGG